MVEINECRIDQEGKNIIIDASVKDLSYYKDVYISSVVIHTAYTNSPEYTGDTFVFDQSFDGEKHINLSISTKEMPKVSNLNDNIFFVYIITDGAPSPDTPCGMDNKYTMGVAVNLRPVYNNAMNYIKELGSDCSIPRGFIDMILRLKAFELSLKTANYPTAVEQWNKLFKNKTGISPRKGCGCNGTN